MNLGWSQRKICQQSNDLGLEWMICLRAKLMGSGPENVSENKARKSLVSELEKQTIQIN